MPKKAAVTVIFVLFLGLRAFAQDAEPNLAFGYGAEVNMYSRDTVAVGATLNFDFKLPGLFAAGLSAAVHGDKSGDATVEGAALVRRYFFTQTHTGFFAQADLGMSFIAVNEGDNYPRLLAGLRGGYRLPLGRMFYVEAYGRGGYPLALGAGLIFGYRN